MKFFDRNSNLDRLNADVQPLVRGMLYNQRRFSDDADDAPYVTEAIKYRREQQNRRKTSQYESEDPFIEDIIDFFGFDPLDFQVNSWETIRELDQKRINTGDPQAALFSAPTGFGKTEAFLGPLYKMLSDNGRQSTIIVYPRRALLQNQLERMLEHVHDMRSDGVAPVSVGVYVGGMPYRLSEVEDNQTFFERGSPSRFRFANCWCGDDQNANSFEYDGTSREYTLSCEQNDDHSFTDRELVLAREDIKNDPPDIILTTLESLELFALKPNYSIIDNVDTIVLDEVHLYTGLRGAHAGKIIDNINDITEQPLLWLGASATVDNPARFAKKLFNMPASRIETIHPPESDFQNDPDDYKHYYFMISPEEGVGASSMMIQQLMLLGHSMLEKEGERGTVLSFIDSISQVNQKRAQFRDAEQKSKLWQYHRSGDDNWIDVAENMDHSFIDEPLSFLSVYSDQGFDATEAAQRDVLLSTSFLEVGIDVGDINIVTQFRQPHNLSSFIQRTGRAARKEDMNSHIGVFLSNMTGDANMFYRAERFLTSDLRTPLKPDNDVVEWIHDCLATYYEVTSDIYSRQMRRPREEKLTFYEEYLNDALELPEFYRFLTQPGDFLDEELGIGKSIDSPLVDFPSIRGTRAALNTKKRSLSEGFDEIGEYIEVDGEEIARTENAFGEYLRRVQDQILGRIKIFEDCLSEYEEVLERANEDLSQIQELRENLKETRSSIDSSRSFAKKERVKQYNELLAELTGIAGQLKGVRARADSISESETTDISLSELDDIQEAINLLDGLAGDERLEKLNQQRRQIYYLNQTIEKVADFNDINLNDADSDESRNDRPQLSLWYTKDLLRAAYYFNRFLAVTDKERLEEVWYVPPNYFESSGQYFTVFQGQNDIDGSQESIDSLVHSYAPFRSEYMSQAGKMQMFMPDTKVIESGEDDEHSTVQFDFTEIPTTHRPNMQVPESIRLSEATDLTGDSAQNIVRYCPQCLQIISDENTCLRHNDKALGKVHSYPQVRTVTRERSVDESYGHLSLCEVTGDVTLEGVTLKITPAKWAGSEIGYTWVDDAERVEREIQSPDSPLGFSVDTRGLILDISDLLPSLDDDMRSQVARYKDLEEVEFEEIVRHTAAHFLLELTADLGGVNSSMLFYGINEVSNEVYVFERTEGGQGIVDLVYNELTINPGDVLQSMNRIAFNPQVLNERLWAEPDVIRSLPMDRPATEEEISEVVREHSEVTYGSVQERVVQEFISTVDRAEQLRLSLGDNSLERAYRVKHQIAQAQVKGEAFPSAKLGDIIDIEDAEQTVTSLFVSPDIDGCVENLHVSECISGHNQEDVLSYVVLEKIYEHLITETDESETAEQIMQKEALPAAKIDDKNIFISF